MDVNNTTSRCRLRTGSGISLFRSTKTAGYTLIELMITIAVIAIISGIGIPGINAILNTNRLASNINALASSLALSRSEAVKRGQTVSLCQSNDQVVCSKSANWETGWMVYVDTNQSRNRDLNEPILLTNSGFADGTSATFNGAFNLDGYIYYKPDGSAFPNGSFVFCANNNPNAAKALILIRTGRVRLSKFKSNGKPLDCS